MTAMPQERCDDSNPRYPIYRCDCHYVGNGLFSRTSRVHCAACCPTPIIDSPSVHYPVLEAIKVAELPARPTTRPEMLRQVADWLDLTDPLVVEFMKANPGEGLTEALDCVEGKEMQADLRRLADDMERNRTYTRAELAGVGVDGIPTIETLVARRTRAKESYYDALESLHLDLRDGASRRQAKRGVALCDERRDRLVDAAAWVQRAKADAYDRGAHNDPASDAANSAANGSPENGGHDAR